MRRLIELSISINMMKSMVKYKILFIILLAAASCAAPQIIEPPHFDYPNLLDEFTKKNPGQHFPVILQKGLNTDPVVSADGYLFYVSDAKGSADIWMRQLSTTVNVPVVEQEAVQDSPAISQNGKLLAYVNYEENPFGDIMITRIEPERIAIDAIRGNALPNHRASSVNLSDFIRNQFAANRDGCAGTYAELDPAFSSDANTLYYASDRCSRGVFRIWSLSLKDGRPVNDQAPQLFSTQAAIQPYVVDGTLVATALDLQGQPKDFLLFSTDSKTSTLVSHKIQGRAIRPLLTSDATEIVFMAVTHDTNGDGRLDLNDRGGVYRLSLKTGIVRPVIDQTMPLYSIATSSFLQDGILYAGYDVVTKSSRIYLSRPGGLIPKVGNVLDQYDLAGGFSGERRRLALESVIQYFGNALEYFLVEYDVLVDLLNTSTTTTDKKRYQDQLSQAEKENPFVRISRLAKPNTVPAIELALRSLAGMKLDKAKADVSKAYLRERLVEADIRQSRLAHAYTTVAELNHDAPDYLRRNSTLIKEVSLQVKLTGKIPDRFRELLAQEQTDAVLKQQLIQVIYEEMNQNQNMVVPAVENESVPVLKGLYLILHGDRLFRQRRYADARNQILEGLKTTGSNNLAYTLGWKLLAAIYDIEQNQQAALDARLRFLQSYNKDWNLDVDESDFIKLIGSSRLYIEGYLTSARSIADEVEERLDQRFFLISDLRNRIIADTMKLDMVDRNRLSQFCEPQSAAGMLIVNLQYKEYIERYAKLCQSVQPYLQGKTGSLTLETGNEISQLFYMVSYANATLINILFLQFKTAGLFDELNDQWSVYYHRWKTDLAIERLSRRLNWDEKQSRLISPDTVQGLFQEKDPFDAAIFKEILVGYRFAEPNAQRYFDHSLLYGYAYLLIKKSEEREKFYDSLLRNGVQIPSSIMASRKAEILNDLKQAEFRLQYILNVDPGYVDATLLLSWLYQYIDERKQAQVLLKPGYIDRIFILLTGIQPSSVRDGIFYRSQYQNTFNSRYYEKNVDVLSSAIDEVKIQKGKERYLSLLEMNLGNNQFQLVNYKAAVESYNRAEQLAQKSGTPVSKDSMQYVLFLINRGRARFYSGDALAAASDFGTAAQELRTYDYWPAFETANRERYRAQSEPSNGYFKSRFEKADGQFKQSRYRLALLQSLRGLAYQNSGKVQQAVGAYTDAWQVLYGHDSVPANAIDRASLENYIAMAFQELEDFDASDLAAKQAADSATFAGLKRNDNRFQPQTVGGRVFGILLGYGEDFSVIGDGRTPFGFSSLRQFELSLGIRLRNAMQQGDLDTAAQLLENRIEVFKKRDGDVRLGSEGQIYALNQRAELSLGRGDYDKAFDDYRKAADLARSVGMLDSFRLNFRNSYLVLFHAFEDTDTGINIAKQMRAGLKGLTEFREQYRKATKENYIHQRETEDPQYSYRDEEDDVVIDRLVLRDLSEFSAIEGLLAYYMYLNDRTADATLLDHAEQHLLEASSADETSTTLSGIRTRLNLLRVYYEKKDQQSVNDLLERLQEETFEFHAIPERIEYLRIRAEMLASEGRLGEAGLYLNQAEQLLVEFPYLLPVVAKRLRPLYQMIAELEIRQNRATNALLALERLRFYELQAEFSRYPIEFSDRYTTDLFRSVRRSQSSLRTLLVEETRLRLSRRDVQEVISARLNELNQLKRDQSELISLNPYLKSFVVGDTIRLPQRNDNKQYIRLFSTPHTSYCLRWMRGKVTVGMGNSALVDCKIESHPTVIAADGLSVTKGLLRSLLSMVGDERVLRPTFTDTAAVMVRSTADIDSNRFLFNIRTDGPGSDDNVVKIGQLPLAQYFAIGSKDRFLPAKWIAQKHTVALALTKSYLGKDVVPDTIASATEARQFQRFWAGLNLSYEVFKAAGGGTFLLYNNKPPAEPSEFGKGDSIAFGIQGFDRKALQPYLIEQHQKLFAQGLASVKDERSTALNYFEMADSIIDGIENEKEVGAKNRLYLARSLILVKPDEGEALFQKLLNEEKGRLEKYALYRSYVGGLSTVKRYTKALAVFNQSVVEFPELADKKSNERIALELLQNLDRVDPQIMSLIGQSELEALFRSERALVPAVKSLLYRHGEYERAQLMGFRNISDQVLSARISLESALFFNTGIDKAIAELTSIRLTEADDDLNLILAAYERRWQYVNDFLRNQRGMMLPGLLEQRQLLARQLHERIEEKAVNLGSLTCLQTKNESKNLLKFISFEMIDIGTTTTVSNCAAQTSTEQVLQFRLALDALPFDDRHQVKAVIFHLIDQMKNTSHRRASIAALVAADTYLTNRMPVQSAEFLALYQSLSKGQPAPAALRSAQTSVTVWLHALNQKVDSQLQKEALQSDQGRSLYGILAIANTNSTLDRSTVQRFFNNLSTSGLTKKDVEMALFFLQEKAITSSDSQLLFDLLIAEKRYRQGRPLQLVSVGSQLQKKILPGQHLTALFDNGQNFRLLDLTTSGITVSIREGDVSELRSRLLQYYQNTGSPGSAVSLAGDYDAMLSRSDDSIYYRWLIGLHSLAPLPLIGNEYQVIDPESLLEGPADDGSFDNRFRVSLRLPTTKNEVNTVYYRTMTHLTNWTNFELDKADEGAANNNLAVQEGWQPLSGIRSWLIFEEMNRPVEDLTPGLRQSSIYQFGTAPAILYRGQGSIARLPVGSNGSVPAFMRAYIKSDLPATTLRHRFDYARQEIQTDDAAWYLFFKPATASVIASDAAK